MTERVIPKLASFIVSKIFDVDHEICLQMRLESTKVAMWILPLSVVGYAWVCEKHFHVSAICVMLFIAGFFLMFVSYLSTFSTCVHLLTRSLRTDGYTQAL